MHIALIVLVVAVVWLLSLRVKPFGPCWACRGRGVRVKKRGRKSKARKCWLCKGKRRRQRIGSRTVHRVWGAAAEGFRDRSESR
jgi:hypothetical protein